MNFAKFSKTLLLQESSGILLLQMAQENSVGFLVKFFVNGIILARLRYYLIFRDGQRIQ